MKRQQVMDLWRTCFDDSDEFIRFYFERKYADPYALLYEQKGEAVATLLMLPYPMSWEEEVVETSYISGACTLPQARRQGLMSRLLTEAFDKMQAGHIALSTLIPAEPWLYDYYARLGYAAVFEYTVRSYQLTPGQALNGLQICSPQKADDPVFESWYAYFKRQMQLRPCCIQHPPKDYDSIIQDLYLAGGRVVVVYTDNALCPQGMAFTQKQEKEIKVKEWFYSSPQVQQELAQAIANLWGNGTITCAMLPEKKRAVRKGMARVTDARQMLEIFAAHHTDLSITFRLKDSQIRENEGVYHLSGGICRQIAVSPMTQDSPELNIAELTYGLMGVHHEKLPEALQGVFPERQPYMSLMLE